MTNKITTWLLGLTIALVLGVCWQVNQIAPSIAALIRMREDKVGTIATHWSSGGLRIDFTSTRMADETPTQFAERVAAELAALKAAFPEDK